LACLSETEVVDWVEGRLPRAERDRLQQHLDGCSTCVQVVAAAAAALPESSGSDAAAEATPRLGRYVLEQRLGVGGMGEVFLARQRGPGGFEKRCVVKRIRPDLTRDSAFAEMFLVEARLAAKLDHPHIVHVYDFGSEGDEWYLAMEYVPGATLAMVRRMLAARGERVPIAVAARIASQVALALDHAHRLEEDGRPLQIVHRDVSPENVMLSTAGAVKLLDFGLAKARTAATTTRVGTVKGKAAYMSPEQARGEAVDSGTDIYALGLVLYELLAGRRAQPGDSLAERQEEIVPIERWRPEVPDPLRSVLATALQGNRERRYQTAGQMSEALERFLTSLGETVTQSDLLGLLSTVGGPDASQLRTELAPLVSTVLDRPALRSWRTVRWLGAGLGAIALVGASLWLARSSVPRQKPTPPSVSPVTDEAPERDSPRVSAAPAPSVRSEERPGEAPSEAMVEPKAVGTLLVSSEPRLQVLVDGKASGRTPAKLALKPGRHHLTWRDESMGLDHSVDVRLEARATVIQSWRPARGTIAFRVLPYAEVFWKGKSLGTTPLAPQEFWEGRQTLTFINPESGLQVNREIDVKPGAETVVKVDLQ
jgi:serine/threonine protein kinase